MISEVKGQDHGANALKSLYLEQTVLILVCAPIFITYHSKQNVTKIFRPQSTGF